MGCRRHRRPLGGVIMDARRAENLKNAARDLMDAMQDIPVEMWTENLKDKFWALELAHNIAEIPDVSVGERLFQALNPSINPYFPKI